MDQFSTQLACSFVDPVDHALRALLQVHGLAAAIVRREPSLNPALLFQPMEKRHQSGLLNAEAGGDLRLRQWLGGTRKMKKSAPFRLA